MPWYSIGHDLFVPNRAWMIGSGMLKLGTMSNYSA